MSLTDVTTLAETVGNTAAAREAMGMVETRKSEFSCTLEMQLAGISMVPQTRQMLDDKLQRLFETKKPSDSDEVVIGSGWHSATYCLARVSRGFAPPLVLEASDYPGGCFAVSRRPAFRANSRNRPGPIGLPGQGVGLNVIPGAVLQPSMLSTEEFQTNADLAFAVRVALASAARVRPNSRVLGIEINDTGKRRYRLTLDSGETVTTDRIIDARGLGESKRPQGVRFDGQTILTFEQFCRKLDSAFPLRGLNRVAVVGDGDGAKCVVEALLGIGPSQLSLSMLDFVKEIDWYGQNLPTTPRNWVTTARCRYAPIGGYFPKVDLDNTFDPNGEVIGNESIRQSRLIPCRVLGNIQPAADGGAYVNNRRYDAVVVAIGYEPHNRLRTTGDIGYTTAGASTTIRTARRTEREEYYEVGPRGELPFDDGDSTRTRSVPQNVAAIFRLAGRTSQLALSLGTPSGL